MVRATVNVVAKTLHFMQSKSRCKDAVLLKRKRCSEGMKMEEVLLDSGCTAGVYLSATEEFIKQLEDAVEDVKRDLGKYVDVLAIMKQLPPPESPPMLSLPMGDFMLDAAEDLMLNDQETEEVMMLDQLEQTLDALDNQHAQKIIDSDQIYKLKDYLLRDIIANPNLPHAAGIVSTLQRFINQVNTTSESYTRKVDVDVIPPN